MKFDSIKSRLMVMTLICVVGMGLLVASQQFFTQKLVHLNQQRDMLLRLGQDLLQMRRHEKDFLLRHQIDYHHRFRERASVFNQRLHSLNPLLEKFSFTSDYAGELAEGIDKYQQLFQRVVDLQTQIGLNAGSGLKGQLFRIEAEVSREPTFHYGSEFYPQLINAKLAIRSFLLTRDPFYHQELNQAVEQMRVVLNTQEATRVEALINQYQVTFESLAQATQKMGLDHNEGLRGEFRRQAHLVEAKLQEIDEHMQPLMEEQENKVKMYSLTIAVITSIILILLLVKSFATFHRAFGNFVMFFYRCKRQYQKIDPRQLGFAEFRSLAVLANEMVETRRDMEQRLADAEAELKKSQIAS